MHKWSFVRAGGFDQVVLATGDDLRSIGTLDQKLWVALSCPTRGLEFDQRTLDLIDTDHDGRIRVPELVAAVTWACDRLVSPDLLIAGAAELPLDSIDTESPEGTQVLASARRVLADLGKADARSISVDDTADTVRIFSQTTFNGDGIIIATSADDAPTRQLIEEIRG